LHVSKGVGRDEKKLLKEATKKERNIMKENDVL
jgi:hypothetical protein